MRHGPRPVLVVMGATGSGKTTVGRLLAQRLGVPFVEGDDYHDPENVARMQRGEPLDDAMRVPWLARLNAVLRASASREGVVLACSALRASYRDTLDAGVPGVRYVYLRADEALLRERLAHRHGHFAGAALVPSQLATLEPPRDAITVDARESPETIVDEVTRALLL
ncbi:MAG TPA: gluconokinase [Acidimicrobiia bacterium]|nr:gluconokinase [Acidimicrobiia bacterium]